MRTKPHRGLFCSNIHTISENVYLSNENEVDLLKKVGNFHYYPSPPLYVILSLTVRTVTRILFHLAGVPCALASYNPCIPASMR